MTMLLAAENLHKVERDHSFTIFCCLHKHHHANNMVKTQIAQLLLISGDIE
jgi:hypothetical protein